MTCYVFIKTTLQPDVSMHNGDYCKWPGVGQLQFLSEPPHLKKKKKNSSASVNADLLSLQVKFGVVGLSNICDIPVAWMILRCGCSERNI